MRSFLLLTAALASGCGIGLDKLGPLEGDTGIGDDGIDFGSGGSSDDGGSSTGGDSGGSTGGSSSGGDSGGSSSGGDSGGSTGGDSGGSSSGGDSGGSTGGDSGGSSGGSSSGGSSGGGVTDSDADGYTSDVDCDDRDRNTYPGAAFLDSTSACMTDADNDGYGDLYAGSGVVPGTDCADNDSGRNPGATEIPYDGIDQNCDGSDAGTTVTAYGTTGFIYDLTTTVGEATVTGCSTVLDIEVNVSITHSYIADLGIAIHEPTLTSYTVLHYFTGIGVSDLRGTYSSAGGGTLTSYDSMSNVTGGTGNGTWYLEIYDDTYYDEGSLDSWSITLTCI